MDITYSPFVISEAERTGLPLEAIESVLTLSNHGCGDYYSSINLLATWHSLSKFDVIDMAPEYKPRLARQQKDKSRGNRRRLLKVVKNI